MENGDFSRFFAPSHTGTRWYAVENGLKRCVLLRKIFQAMSRSRITPQNSETANAKFENPHNQRMRRRYQKFV